MSPREFLGHTGSRCWVIAAALGLIGSAGAPLSAQSESDYPASSALAELPPEAGVFISEFMAENRRTLNDEDGDSSDWIELYNPATEPVSLEGWFLTDDAQQLSKWRFPPITLFGQAHLVVFASAKNKTNLTGRLHTNFKLAAAGNYLALVNSQTNVVSEFAPLYPVQTADVSYGRAEGDPQTTGYFLSPTPGALNAIRGPGFAPAVEFSQTTCTFTQSFSLTLATDDANAVIHYTLDGRLPTNSSPVYTRPISVQNSVQIRARAFQPGLLPGPPRSEAFLLLGSNAVPVSSDLPLLVLHSLGQGAPNASRLNFVQVTLHEPVFGGSALTYPPTLASRAAIQIRGSSTAGITKSSYKLEFRDEFDLDRDRPVLGMPAAADWVLYAPNQYEPVLIHNPFVHQLSRDLGRYSPRTRFVEVYFNKSTGPIVSNSYQGIYVLEEKVEIGPDRVAIDPLKPENTQPPEVTGGYLMKIDRLDPGDRGFSAAGVTAAFVEPKEREIRTAQRLPQLNYLSNYFKAFGRALNSTTWRDPIQGYPAFIDIDSWIDYHVLEVLSGNVDALVLSTYFHKPRNDKLVFGPHWDFDRALGSTDGRDANPRRWTTGPFFSAAWWNRLFGDVDFWQRWVDRWQDLRSSHFALTNLNGLIDRLAGEVSQAQPREYLKWRVTLRGGSYASEVKRMKDWLSNRIDFIDGQLTPRPVFNPPNGYLGPNPWVTLQAATNSTVYYTLDGSDPRAALGGISPRAIAYQGPFMLSTNSRIVARALNPNKRQVGGPPTSASTPWSGPVAATFLVTPTPILLTEIMFHPATAGLITTGPLPQVEYLELMNAGSSPVNLAGFHLAGDVDFTFSSQGHWTNFGPGDRIVLAQDLAAFRAYYPTVTNLAGAFAGALKNRGNRLTLVAPWQETVFDFVFQDSWAKLADGLGFSLVLADDTTPPAQLGHGALWQASAQSGGSPGCPEPPRPDLPRVLINEVVTCPASGQDDVLELLNDSWQPADLSGWWLSDDFQEPKKYRIPPGSLIPGKGLLLVQPSQPGPGTGPGFGLNALGESIYIFSADANGELTGWYHGFEFGPQEPGTSYARWITSEGQEYLVPHTQPSLGWPNPVPATAPVAISEIMYAPAVSQGVDSRRDQYVEIIDLTLNDPPLQLADPTQSGEGWRLRGDVAFDIAPGFRFPPHRRVVIVGFDPDWNLEALAGFRAHYRLDSQVVILGPWRGQLLPAGGTIQLLKPLAAAAEPGSYVLVEELRYSTQSPWPDNAQGTDRSIQHQYPQLFSSEPSLWEALPATPGDHDGDRDDLPDLWERSVGLDTQDGAGEGGAHGDPDQDGYTNLQEYWAGTAPLDPHSHLHLEVTAPVNGRPQFGFSAGPSRSYTVLCRDHWQSSEWRVLKKLRAPLEGGLITFSDSPANSTRFYRLCVP